MYSVCVHVLNVFLLDEFSKQSDQASSVDNIWYTVHASSKAFYHNEWFYPLFSSPASRMGGQNTEIEGYGFKHS